MPFHLQRLAALAQASGWDAGSSDSSSDGGGVSSILTVLDEAGDPLLDVNELGSLEMYGEKPSGAEAGAAPPKRIVLKGAHDADDAHGMIDVLRDDGANKSFSINPMGSAEFYGKHPDGTPMTSPETVMTGGDVIGVPSGCLP